MALPVVSRMGAKIVNSLAGVLSNVLPTSVLGRLSGLGEPPPIGTSASMATIQQAIRTAEYGDTFLLFALYRDIYFNWSHLQCELGKRVMAVVGQENNIQPADKEDQDDVQAAEAIEDMIANCDNWDEGQRHLMNGHIWPVAGCEKIFEPVPASEQFKWRHPVRYRLKRLHPINYGLFCYRIPYLGTQSSYYSPNPLLGGGVGWNNGHGNPNNPTVWNPDDWEPDLRFYSTLPNGMINWNVGETYKPDRDRHVIHRGNFLTGFRDNYGGAMRSISAWWLLAQLGRDWFARFMERYGSPFVVAYMQTQQKDLVDMVEKALGGSSKLGSMILPDRTRVELKETMVSGAADGYCKYVELCNKEVSKIVVGQEMSTTATPAGLGSGQADLQGDVRQDIRKFDERQMSGCNRTQIFDQWLRINGFRGQAPNIVYGGLSEQDMVSFSKTLLTLNQAGLRPTDASLPTVSANVGIEVERAPEPKVDAREPKSATSQN